MTRDMPNISAPHLDTPDSQKLEPRTVSAHAPRILLLYGSLRPTSYSRLLTLEAERILRHFGAQTSVVFHSVWNLNGYLRELPSAGCRVRFWSR